MHSYTVPVLFCVLSIAIGQVAANAACQVPFQQHPTRPDLCYTRLPKRKCDWIPGSVFLSGNCFVPSGHDVVPSKKFFCDFNEYFQHCQNVPGHCCMQSTKFECDKYNNVTYDAILKTCFAPVSEIEIRTAANVVCPKFFEWDDSYRQCVADVNITNPDPQITKKQCEAAGGQIIGNQCLRDPNKPNETTPICADITDPNCSPPPFPTTTSAPITTVETTEPTTTDEPETTTVTDSTTSLPTEHTTTSEPTGATTNDGLTTTTPLPSTSGTESTTFISTTTTKPNVTSTTITPPTTGTTGVTESTPADITGTSTPPSTESPNDGSSSGGLTTTTPLPTSAETNETTSDPTTTIDSNVTATTTTTPITETTVVTNSGTVTTTTPGPFTTPNSTSDGATTSATPPSTGAPSSVSTPPPTPTGPTTSDPTESTTPLPNGSKFNGTVPRGFNVSHNCPIGYMITEHFCIGVYTPDCETNHNGYKYEEACFIRFNDTGSNVGKREIVSDDIPKGTVAPVGILSTLLSKPTTLPSTITPISTTTTTTTKPPTKPSTTKRPVTPPRPKCRDHFRNCLQLKNDGNCDILNRRKEMKANCSRTCGFC